MSKRRKPQGENPRLGKALAKASEAKARRAADAGQAPKPPPAAQAGKPKWAAADDAPSGKVTVTLKDRQTLYLDRLALNIRAASGVQVNRSELMQSLVDALAESGLDLSTAASDAELRAVLVAHLTKG